MPEPGKHASRSLQAGAFLGVVLAMCVIVLDLHLAWFVAAAVVVAACSIGGWALERRERRSGG